MPEELAAFSDAAEAEIELVLLLTAYGRGGLPRFRQDSAAAYLAQVESLRARVAEVDGLSAGPYRGGALDHRDVVPCCP